MDGVRGAHSPPGDRALSPSGAQEGEQDHAGVRGWLRELCEVPGRHPPGARGGATTQKPPNPRPRRVLPLGDGDAVGSWSGTWQPRGPGRVWGAGTWPRGVGAARGAGPGERGGGALGRGGALEGAAGEEEEGGVRRESLRGKAKRLLLG